MSKLMEERQDFVGQHTREYLGTKGAKGHIVNLKDIGAPGPGFMATLLLKTIGRKSGNPLVVPLLYGCYRGDFVVVGSKGAAVEHPAWFYNLESGPEVSVQVATQYFKGPWRIVEDDAEHDRIWAFMLDVYPQYAKYQEQVERRIPLVLVTPREEVESL